jgi:N6-adenosine-specific RNA methylase IME4
VKYKTIVADPPWEYPEGFVTLLGEGPKTDGSRRDLTRHSTILPYPSMSVEQIELLPIMDLADECAHLFLWTTNKWLHEAFHVVQSWGFQYRQLLVWLKERHSPFVRSVAPNNCEYLLVCRRGNLKWTGSLPCNLIEIGWSANDARRRHSTKPEAFLDYIEQISPGPYLELFARRQRLGWDTWGNEALEHINFGESA